DDGQSWQKSCDAWRCCTGLARLITSGYYPPTMKNNAWRAVVEVGFIIFLFYSNLLMGELERSLSGRDKGLLWDLRDIFTWKNLVVAVVAGLIGYVLVERLRDGRRYVRKE